MQLALGNAHPQCRNRGRTMLVINTCGARRACRNCPIDTHQGISMSMIGRKAGLALSGLALVGSGLVMSGPTAVAPRRQQPRTRRPPKRWLPLDAPPGGTPLDLQAGTAGTTSAPARPGSSRCGSPAPPGSAPAASTGRRTTRLHALATAEVRSVGASPGHSLPPPLGQGHHGDHHSQSQMPSRLHREHGPRPGRVAELLGRATARNC